MRGCVLFEDRKDAGRKLAAALEQYKNSDVLVLAIPKGGVEIGYQVAILAPQHLKLPTYFCANPNHF